jgi:hypothetical protein
MRECIVIFVSACTTIFTSLLPNKPRVKEANLLKKYNVVLKDITKVAMFRENGKAYV